MEPRSYQEVLDRGYIPGRDFRIAFGDGNIARCLLAAPHGGGIEPGTSEILRVVADMGGWAWYDFAGFLRQGNNDALHITSTQFDEPGLLALLPLTNFVLSLHGASDARHPVAYVGGNWQRGRETITAMIDSTSALNTGFAPWTPQSTPHALCEAQNRQTSQTAVSSGMVFS